MAAWSILHTPMWGGYNGNMLHQNGYFLCFNRVHGLTKLRNIVSYLDSLTYILCYLFHHHFGVNVNKSKVCSIFTCRLPLFSFCSIPRLLLSFVMQSHMICHLSYIYLYIYTHITKSILLFHRYFKRITAENNNWNQLPKFEDSFKVNFSKRRFNCVV